EGRAYIEAAMDRIDGQSRAIIPLLRALVSLSNASERANITDRLIALAQVHGARDDLAHGYKERAYAMLQLGRIGDADLAISEALRSFSKHEQNSKAYAKVLSVRAQVLAEIPGRTA